MLRETAISNPVSSASRCKLERQLRVLRVLSALLSTAAVALTFVAARAFAPRRPAIALASALLVAALPMHILIGGTVNSDNLATLLGAAAAATIAWSMRRRADWRTWLAAIVATGLLLLTKRAALGLLPALAVACLLPSREQVRRAIVLPTTVGAALPLFARLVVTAVVLLALGWLGVRLLSAVPEGMGGYLFNEPEHPEVLARISYRSSETRSLVLWHLGWLLWSFWGVFGWWSIMLPDVAYRALAAASSLAIVGFLLFAARAARQWLRCREAQAAVDVRLTLFVLMPAAGAVGLAIGERIVYQSWAQVPQGRYLFITIAPLALVHVVGPLALLPSRLAASHLPLAALGLIALDVVVYLRYLAPFYARIG